MRKPVAAHSQPPHRLPSHPTRHAHACPLQSTNRTVSETPVPRTTQTTQRIYEHRTVPYGTASTAFCKAHKCARQGTYRDTTTHRQSIRTAASGRTARCTAVRLLPYRCGRHMARKAATVQASNPLVSPHRPPYRMHRAVRARCCATHEGGGGGGRGFVCEAHSPFNVAIGAALRGTRARPDPTRARATLLVHQPASHLTLSSACPAV